MARHGFRSITVREQTYHKLIFLREKLALASLSDVIEFLVNYFEGNRLKGYEVRKQ